MIRMAPQLPELPKISGFIEALARPEMDIAARIQEATRVPLPPGPASMALNLARSVEARRLPEAPVLPRLQEILPKLEPPAKAPKTGEQSGETGEQRFKLAEAKPEESPRKLEVGGLKIKLA